MTLPEDWAFQLGIVLIAAATTFFATVWAVGRTLDHGRKLAREERQKDEQDRQDEVQRDALRNSLRIVNQAARLFHHSLGQKQLIQQGQEHVLHLSELRSELRTAAILLDAEVQWRIYQLGIHVSVLERALIRGYEPPYSAVGVHISDLQALLGSYLYEKARPQWLDVPEIAPWFFEIVESSEE